MHSGYAQQAFYIFDLIVYNFVVNKKRLRAEVDDENI